MALWVEFVLIEHNPALESFRNRESHRRFARKDTQSLINHLGIDEQAQFVNQFRFHKRSYVTLGQTTFPVEA